MNTSYMNTSKILVFTLLFFSILKTETINAQIESANKKKDNLKGPICLYKKTVQKDFVEKFGEYEPGNSTIAAWYIYDKEGRKIFSQEPNESNHKFFSRDIYLYEKGKLQVRASSLVNVSDNNISQDGYHNYYFYKYLPNNTIEERFYGAGGKEVINLTEKIDNKNNLIERYARLGTDWGFKLVKTYDDNSQIIEETKYDGYGKIKYKQNWKRDANGNTTEWVEYNADGSLKNKNTYKYNNAGKETEVICYKSNGAIDWGAKKTYINDTLLSKYYGYTGNEKTPSYIFKIDYNSNNQRIKDEYEYSKGKKVDEYITHIYNASGQNTETHFFKDKKLTEKHIFSDFVGEQNQLKKTEVYDSTGNIVELIEYRYDKYGNEIAYEKYKVTTSFGEKKKIPVEKRKVEISYYDGNPKFKVKVAYEKRKNSKKKKENYIIFDIDQFGSEQPKLYLFRKPGVTGGKEVEVNRGGLRSYQLSMFSRFYLSTYIVESGNYIVLMKRPESDGVWSLENSHVFQY